MQIIKDHHIIDNTWQYVEDDAVLPLGDVVVSFNRWQQEKHQILHRTGGGQVGIRLRPDQPVMELANDISHLQLIELDFSDFADGRSFSQAWLLRERLAYKGELRAAGQYMPDQVFYLARVGVNAFIPEKFEDLPILLAKLHAFTVNYQTSVH